MEDKQQQEIALIVETTPVVILQNAEKKAALFAHIEQEIAEFVPDLTSDKGRKAIASLAFKVTKTKTAIETAKETLIEDARKTVNAVNGEWKNVREHLDGLRDKARAPLTAWEEAEEARQTRVAQAILDLQQADKDLDDATADDIGGMYDAMKNKIYALEEFGEEGLQLIELNREMALPRIDRLFKTRAKQEADAAELAELRRQQEERAAAEEAQREEERLAEEAKQEAERRAEEEREREEKQKGAEKAAEERAAQAERDRAAEEQKRRDEAHAAEQQAKQDEINRLKREKALRIEQEEEKARADAARQADRDHRGKIMGEVKADLISVCSLDPAVAHMIVLAIVANNIRNTSIAF